jgi:hypothetical protein
MPRLRAAAATSDGLAGSVLAALSGEVGDGCHDEIPNETAVPMTEIGESVERQRRRPRRGQGRIFLGRGYRTAAGPRCASSWK